MAPLHNPERGWARPAALTSFDRAEVERRIGPVQGTIELLSGGRANLNLHVVGLGVLRIYRSELGGAQQEAQLLRLPWQQLRVPRVLQQGTDFLLLEYVHCLPLLGSEAHGSAVGAALAEIHARRFPQPGLLGPELTVTYPLGAELELLEQHARERLERAGRAQLALQLQRCLAPARALLGKLTRPFVLLHSDFKVSNLYWTSADQLLVLDWETAYAGPALLDIGQLLRWAPPEPFVRGFARAYQAYGGELPSGWQQHAEAFDAINLAFLLAGAERGSLCDREVEARLLRTLAAAGQQ
jgi:hypothetical protein